MGNANMMNNVNGTVMPNQTTIPTNPLLMGPNAAKYQRLKNLTDEQICNRMNQPFIHMINHRYNKARFEVRMILSNGVF